MSGRSSAAGRIVGTGRIAMIAHVGTTNLGDEAILEAAIDVLRTWTPPPDIVAFSVDAADTASRHGIAAYPLRAGNRSMKTLAPAPERGGRPAVPAAAARRPWWDATLRSIPGVLWTVRGLRSALTACRGVVHEVPFVFQSWRRLRGTQLVVVAGSNQLGDWFGGAWGFPYTLLKWCALARVVGARVVFLGVGAGPLDARLSRRFCRHALGSAAFVSFRDEGSQALMRACGFREASVVAPDLAFGLQPTQATRQYAAGAARVVVNVFPYKDPHYDPLVTVAGEPFRKYVAMMAEVATGLVERGHDVSFVCSQRADRRVIELVLQQCGVSDLGAASIREPKTVAELRQVLADADFVVASRFHGILLSLLGTRPVVALCYQSKSRQLMESVGMGQFALDIAETDATQILGRFEELKSRHFLQSDALWRHVMRLHRASLDQYAVAASLAGAAPAAGVDPQFRSESGERG
jgi:polysaccharide pyruvyl transferase WcaK-like protein